MERGGKFERYCDRLIEDAAEEAGEGGGEAGRETATGSHPLDAKPLCSGCGELGYVLR